MREEKKDPGRSSDSGEEVEYASRKRDKIASAVVRVTEQRRRSPSSDGEVVSDDAERSRHSKRSRSRSRDRGRNSGRDKDDDGSRRRRRRSGDNKENSSNKSAAESSRGEKRRRYEEYDERDRRRDDRHDDEYDRRRSRRYDDDRKDSRYDSRTKDDSRRRERDGGREDESKKNERKDDETSKATDTSKPDEATSAPEKPKSLIKDLFSRTGGAYIPPAKLRQMQAQITDKTSLPYQRLAWEALKKSLTGLVNKVNQPNLGIIVRELFKENIVRGRGLLTRCIIQAQNSSPTFTHVYAALVAVINSKFPNIGELLLKRLVIQFRRGFRRHDKALCISSVKFIAHLVNQGVAHEILALEILTLLVENPTDDSVEVAIAFLKEVGDKLTQLSSKALHSVFEMLRNILHEGKLDKRVQYMIEVMHQVRKDGFKDNPAVMEGLDVVEDEDQFTHLITLDEATDPQDGLNVFKFDAEYEANETKYADLRKELLDEDSDGGESGSEGSSGSDDSDSEKEEAAGEGAQTIIDNTETNLVALRRTIYLTITSSLDFEECAHKLLKMQLKPGQESELCNMFLDCCAQQRTYEKFFGLLAQRFCQINKIYVEPFQKIFQDTFSTVHRLETKMLRNVAKFFAHLLFTDSISWEVLNCVKLTEEETNSSSRIFIKILFQELSEYMGLQKLNDRVKDTTLQTAFEGLFPRDNPKNTRFAINFFTSIGLGGLTDELREHLKNQPKMLPPAFTAPQSSSSSYSSSSSSSSSASSSSSESSSSSSSSSDDSDSDSEPKSKKKRKTKKKPIKKISKDKKKSKKRK